MYNQLINYRRGCNEVKKILSTILASFVMSTLVLTNMPTTKMAFAEEGTKYSGTDIKTGIDHLKELGVTHVQILPMYDYASVDEAVNNDDNNNDNNNDDSSSSFDNKAIMLVLLAMIAFGSASFVAYRKKDM